MLKLFKRPLPFLRFQYCWLSSRFRDLVSRLVLKWSSPKPKSAFRPSIKLHSNQIAPAAQALHAQMYTAFAEGSAGLLRKICTDGIYESLRARLAARARSGETVTWEVLKYNRPSKLVSNRAARLPIDGAGIRQAVVRICSQQRLTRYDAHGKVVKGTGTPRDVVEYVVLQRAYVGWKEAPWKVWGTTRETRIEDMEDWNKKTSA